jgi:hypothetical protein
MENNPTLQPLQSHKARRWPWALGILSLAFCHVAFLLPLRAFVPVPPGTDPWWAMGLVLMDGTAVVMLIRMGLRAVTHMRTQKADE